MIRRVSHSAVQDLGDFHENRHCERLDFLKLHLDVNRGNLWHVETEELLGKACVSDCIMYSLVRL